jgi:phosphoribosylformylglycinamidine cyclo-ligase
MKSSYSASGVNITEGDKFVSQIKSLVQPTFSKNTISGIGNFGAFFRIPRSYKNPVYVASTDGVGTKLKIAVELNKHDTVGEDLVNHCANDIAVCGAKPLFFLDYLAFGKLNSFTAAEIVKGLAKACINNKCSLIGGETAEMPGMYGIKDYDLAGTIVGVCERRDIINKKNVKTGDVLIGISSNGLHTNGYSFVRKYILPKIKLKSYIEELGCSLGEELLKIHKTYLKLIQAVTGKIKVSSIAHITGGGILGNTARVVPDNLKIKIDWYSWQRNPVFDLIKDVSKTSENEMRKVFNLGIGLVLIVRKNDVNKTITILKKLKEKNYIIGDITKK